MEGYLLCVNHTFLFLIFVGNQMVKKLSGFIFPAMFIIAWILSFSGSLPPGVDSGSHFEERCIGWLLYFCVYAFLSAALMHSFFAEAMAQSIGWKSNGFQYEIAAVSLGLGLSCIYALSNSYESQVTVSISVIAFLFLAGLNHLKEVIMRKNYSPNNLYILVWDFGVSISLFILIFFKYLIA